MAGLSATERSEAIAAITAGVIPANPTVLSSAIELSGRYLGDKHPDRMRSEDQLTLIVGAVPVALGILEVAANFSEVNPLDYLALAALGGVVVSTEASTGAT